MNMALAGCETMAESRLPHWDREGWSQVIWKHTPLITGFTLAARVFS